MFRIVSYEEYENRGTKRITYKQKAKSITFDYINIAKTELFKIVKDISKDFTSLSSSL